MHFDHTQLWQHRVKIAAMQRGNLFIRFKKCPLLVGMGHCSRWCVTVVMSCQHLTLGCFAGRFLTSIGVECHPDGLLSS